jgi:hypothetical protein
MWKRKTFMALRNSSSTPMHCPVSYMTKPRERRKMKREERKGAVKV